MIDTLKVLFVFITCSFASAIFAQGKALPPGKPDGSAAKPTYVQVNDSRTVNQTLYVTVDRRTLVINQGQARVPEKKMLRLVAPQSTRAYFEIIKTRFEAIDFNLATSSEGLELAQDAEVVRTERAWMVGSGLLGAAALGCLSLICLSDVGAQFVHETLPSFREIFDAARGGLLTVPGAKFLFPIAAAGTGASIGISGYLILATLKPDSQDPMLVQAFVQVRSVDTRYKILLTKKKSLAAYLKEIHSIEREALLRIRNIAVNELKTAKKRDSSGVAAMEVQVRYHQALAAISSLTAAALARIEPHKGMQTSLMELATACGSRTQAFFQAVERAKPTQ